ncbi:MAG: type 1 glutamine amidotransferase [Candidatus Thermoplasmatota archaeon]|nr:type 1 glutamine amidotransferase [Candidatus Thermoplasmatota archaeon]MBS3790227.1 type 1 glutamine amidotransferase [Candidatus Thermoplasmatota archaeon]
MTKAIVLLENGFEDTELTYPYYRLQEAGLKVDLVAEEAEEIYESKNDQKIRSHKAAENVDASDYNLLVIPGGRGPDRMRIKEPIVNLAQDAVDNGLIIASICHGAQLLIETDLLEGKKATCYYSVRTDLENAGAEFLDQKVVVDGNLVTSRHPGDLPAFMEETLKLL